MLTTLFNYLSGIIAPLITRQGEGILIVEPRSQGPLKHMGRSEGYPSTNPRAEYSLQVIVRGQP